MTGFRRKLFQTSAVLAFAVIAAGCAPDVRSHGFAPVEEDLARVSVGVDTRGSVRRKIGRPGASGIFNEQGWYYVSSTVEHYLYYDPEVIDRKIVAVLFDENDVVASVNTYGIEDGKIINLETNTTPTYGRELTILEQAFGNIGVNAEEVFNQ